MHHFTILLLALLWLTACSQSGTPKTNNGDRHPQVGGGCEGCEAVYESKTPFDRLNEVDTLPDFSGPGPKLVISGIVYKADGKTPAPNVVLYVYHTDQTGKYTPDSNATGWARRHGRLRGWLKTNERGEYGFYTLRPAPYPNASVPAHIHPVIKEPGLNEYYLDEYRFDDDALLTPAERAKEEGRGGNGIIHLTMKNGLWYGKRNIYLGRKIPAYPAQ